MRSQWIVSFMVVGCLFIAARISPAADPPANTLPLGDAGLRFVPPPDENWQVANDSSAKRPDYVARTHDGRMAMQMVEDMVVNDAVTEALVKQLKSANQKAKAKVLMEPTVESDDRFTLKVHERVEVGTGDKKKVSDQLHLYRYTGKWMVMATINTIASDPEAVKAELAAGEDMLLSVTGPGVKPPRKPASKPATKPTSKPASRPKAG
jgi:hypothetical protein